MRCESLTTFGKPFPGDHEQQDPARPQPAIGVAQENLLCAIAGATLPRWSCVSAAFPRPWLGVSASVRSLRMQSLTSGDVRALRTPTSDIFALASNLSCQIIPKQEIRLSRGLRKGSSTPLHRRH